MSYQRLTGLSKCKANSSRLLKKCVVLVRYGLRTAKTCRLSDPWDNLLKSSDFGHPEE